jgi:starch phosphorylase
MMDILENKIIPTYYKDRKQWVEIMKNAMTEIEIEFDSGRMADEYYQKMFK